jgi:ComF family protein
LPPYSGARAFGCYSAELSRIIQALKFDGRRGIAGLLAPLLASTLLDSWGLQEIDVIVPVPLHPKRKRERGYNQAALLGRSLAILVGLPFCDNALARVRSTLPQVGLSDKERAHNMRHAFRCVRPTAIRGLRVLLIDDVMTTGSTVANACEALLEGGALRVSVLAVARAVAGSE